MIEDFLLILFIIIAIHYLYFLFKIYNGLNKLSSRGTEEVSKEYISVVVPFRNEEANIPAVYSSLINQSYPKDKFEIIFVNDSSKDNSLSILRKIATAQNVFIYNAPDDNAVKAHKKRAVQFGIDKSKGEIIVTTDADCSHPVDWLKNLLKFMDEETAFVSGPVRFSDPRNYFEKIQSLEFAGLIITGAGLIGSNTPMICNAANIAYRKKVFQELGGFSSQLYLSSGDDELLMQKIHRETGNKIKFAVDKNAVVSTNAKKSVRDFYLQRKRWASKGLFYKNKFILLKLILIYLFYLSLLIQPILGFLISAQFLLLFCITFTIKMLTEYLVLKKGIKLLFEKNLLNTFFVTEILQVPYIVIAGFAGVFGNYIWKDRKIRR